MTAPITTRRILPWIKFILGVELAHITLEIFSTYQQIILQHIQFFTN